MKGVGVVAALAVLGLAACSPKPVPQDASEASPESAAASIAASDVASQAVASSFDARPYVGAWTGARGAILKIVAHGAAYTITIGDHDYPAVVKDGTLNFDRDGSAYSLTKGSGAATGEGELSGRSDCVIVAAGEGYCK